MTEPMTVRTTLARPETEAEIRLCTVVEQLNRVVPVSRTRWLRTAEAWLVFGDKYLCRGHLGTFVQDAMAKGGPYTVEEHAWMSGWVLTLFEALRNVWMERGGDA